MLASFGQGSNSIKSAEQGAGLGLPIAKSLVDLHGGTFTLKSKLRIGTEVIVTFPPERVMSALAPMAEPAPRRIQPARPRARRSRAAAAVRKLPLLPGLIAASLASATDCVPRPRSLCSAVRIRDSWPRMPRSNSPCIKVCTLDPRSRAVPRLRAHARTRSRGWIALSDGERAAHHGGAAAAARALMQPARRRRARPEGARPCAAACSGSCSLGSAAGCSC